MTLNWKHWIATTLAAWVWIAQAALPEPPDPREVAQLTPGQRIEQMRQLNQALAQASVQERREFRAQALHKWQTLTREERHAVHQRMRADWAAMSEEQRQEMRELRKAGMANMTPEERAEMRRERRRMFERMSPEERQHWREDMHRAPNRPDASARLSGHAPIAPDAQPRPDSGR